MTTPVDPRPYAGPGDLVTAADVARWLREWRSAATDRELIAAVDWVHAYDVQDLRNAHDLAQELASQALDARLERERRQACRRGALACWRGAMVCLGDAGVARARRHPRRKLGTLPLVACASVPGSLRPWQAAFVLLARALAFRAAARAP